MDEVDRTILSQLRDIDCPIDDEVSLLKDLDPIQVVTSVLYCLRVICPNDESIPPDPKGTTNMAVKYNVATFIADRCLQLGFRGDLGYQSFLYGSEGDVRRVFLFLIEKLPQETSFQSIDKEVTVADIVRRSEQLTQLWMPVTDVDKCGKHEEIKTVNIGNILNGRSIVVNKISPDKRRYFDNFSKIPFHDVSSLLRWNRDHLHSDKNTSLSRKLNVSFEKPIIIPRKKKTSLEHSTESSKSSEFEVDVDTHNEEAKLVTKTSEQLKKDEIEEKIKIIHETTANIDKLDLKIKELDDLVKEEQLKLLELKSQNLTIEELREMEELAKKDLKQLEVAWTDLKSQLMERLRDLRGNKSDLERELVTIKAAIQVKRKEMSTKEQLLKEITDSIPNPMPPSRQAYTKRVIEVIEKTKKLDEENAKVIRETRSLEKEITFLTGKVQRSFNVADETVFKLAKMNDPFGKRVYKLLAAMHEESDRLSEAIELLGSVKRDILRLEESVGKQASSDLEVKLEQIQRDYLEMKETNKKLIQEK